MHQNYASHSGAVLSAVAVTLERQCRYVTMAMPLRYNGDAVTLQRRWPYVEMPIEGFRVK